MLAGAIAAWVAHEFVLCFIKTYAFSTLLPIGIFLRAFGIRSAANALIGLSIALYFVYPFLMVQVGEMLNNYFMIGDDGQIQKPIICVGNGEPADENKVYIKNGPFAEDPNVPSSVRLQNRLDAEKVIESEIVIAIEKMLFPSVVFGGVYCVYNTGISDTFKIFLNILSSLGLWSLPAAASGLAALNLILKWTNLSWVATAVGALLISFVLHAMYDIVFFVFVVSIVLPILMIFMTITVAKEIAKALGTEIDLSAIEKII
jgi:hypothetical protein